MSTLSNTPDRPRPQYGEYATPEQLAAARGLTLEQMQDQITPPRVAVPADSAAPAAATAAAPAAQSADAAAPAQKRRLVDRAVTIGLLAFGLFYTLLNIPGFLAMSETMQLSYDFMGYGEFRATDLAATLGVVAAVLQVAIWLVTASVSFAMMKRGRAAWWVAVAGGMVALIAFAVISTIILSGDPTFVEMLNKNR